MKNLDRYILENIEEDLKITKDTEIDDLYDTSGVYAYFKGGYMTDDEDYIKKHKKDAIGVAVISEVDDKLHRIVLDKTDVDKKYYGGYRKNIEGATTTKDKAVALEDMNGEANTIAISKAYHGYDDGYRVGSAAEDCQARFNGKGHLPSIGEWKMLYDNKDNVDKMMTIINGTPLKEGSYWSSTLYETSRFSWRFAWYNGIIYLNNRSYKYNVRAAMEI